MKSRYLVPLFLIAVLAGTVTTLRADEAPPFNTYKIILERNIFDSSRQVQSKPLERRREERKPDRLFLSGVFLNDREAVAFFGGSRSEFSKAVRLGERIAGNKILEIKTDSVLLKGRGQTLKLPVTGQMERLEDGPWTISKKTTASYMSSETAPATANTAESAGENTPATNASSSDDSKSAEPDDLVKRLMERRKKELGE